MMSELHGDAYEVHDLTAGLYTSQRDLFIALHQVSLWSPNTIPFAAYPGDPRSYAETARQLRDEVGQQTVSMSPRPEWTDARQQTVHWLGHHDRAIAALAPYAVSSSGIVDSFHGQLTDTLYAFSVLPKVKAAQEFEKKRTELLRQVLGTESLTAKNLRFQVITGKISEVLLGSLKEQMSHLEVRGEMTPFEALPDEEKQAVTDFIGDDLLDLWRSGHPYEIELMLNAERPFLQYGRDELPRLMNAATNRRNVLRMFLTDTVAYKALIDKAAHYTEPEEADVQASELQPGQELELHQGEAIPKMQLEILFEQACTQIATDMLKRHDGSRQLSISNWKAASADAVAKLTKSFNGKITTAKLIRIPTDEERLAKDFKNKSAIPGPDDVRYFMLVADLKSSGRPPIPSSIEFMMYFNHDSIYRVAQKVASGQQKVDAMIADAQENARIIEVEKIERAGSAGAPGTGKKR